MSLGDKTMDTLFEKYIETHGFVASVDSMAAMIEDSLSADFDLEPNPLQAIAVVVYTATRLGDTRPLSRMAAEALRYADSAHSWQDSFRLHYALAAAGEEPLDGMYSYLQQEGEYSFKAAIRIASLAYFKHDERLLYACLAAMRSSLNEQAILEPDQEWELDYAEAMYSTLKCGRADLVSLCRTASRVGDSYYLPFVSTDVNILQRSVGRKTPKEPS